MSHDSVVSRWRDQLAELGALGAALRDAIVGNHMVAAIAAAVRIRQVRAELEPTDDAAAPTGTADELAALAQASALVAPARVADAVLERWIARPLPADAVLLRSPLGVAVLAESLLPPVWDLARDVVVLVGESLAPVADVLTSLGQRRIVRHDLAQPISDVATAIRAMQPCTPGRLVVRTEVGVDADAAREIVRAGEDAISDLRIQRNTVATFSRTWVDQGLANLPAIARWPSIAAVGDHLRGLPMVIVAPGPSLAKNAHLLKQLEGRAVVTAFSHSLRPVLAAGITPDVVVAVDPQDLRYHFAGCDVSRTFLVNGATVHPGLFQMGARGYLGVAANAQLDDWVYDALGDDAIAPGGGSVATTALSLALRWGCDPIVFVGLDLSFSDAGYYVSTSVDGHARAEVSEDGQLRVAGWSPEFRAMRAHTGDAPAETVTELPGYHGGTVRSSFMFAMFHRWFVDRMTRVTDRRVYNCTEGGAYIAGMDHRTLADVIAELPHGVDGRAALDAVVAASDAVARRGAMARHLGKQLRALGRCRTLARRARRRADANDPRLVDVEAQLTGELRPLRVASLLAQRELERANDRALRPADAATYLAASQQVFDTLLRVLDRLEPSLRSVRAELGRSHVIP